MNPFRNAASFWNWQADFPCTFFAAIQMLLEQLHWPGFLATWLDLIAEKIG